MNPRPALLLFLAVALLHCAPPAPAPNPPENADSAPIREVNVFIGTGGSGFGQGSLYPGATVPFGMVKLSPDTNGGTFGRASFAHYGGYWYHDTRIEGFSHTHLSGPGLVDYGNVTLMPTLGMSAAKTSYEGYGAPFTHSLETAGPGRYSVTLPTTHIRVELTATAHTGVHRYHFPAGADAVVILDLGHALDTVTVEQSSLEVLPKERRIRGQLKTQGDFTGRFGGVTIYVDAVFSRAWKMHGTWSKGELFPMAATAAAAGDSHQESTGAYFHFDNAVSKPVDAVVGLSFVSLEAAHDNRLAETSGKDFDQLRAEAEAAWEDRLDRIQVSGGTSDERAMFYSALYHSFQMPTLYSDVSGAYINHKGEPANANGFAYYSDMSLWDTYRTLHPLLTLIDPKTQLDFIRSLIVMAEDRGSLPRWPMSIGDGASMIGTPADIVIADSYVKGIRGFDAAQIFDTMVSTATLGDPFGMRRGLEGYLQLGYCAADEVGGSVSVTLENMYADFAIAQFAQALGRSDEEKEFRDRAGRYNVLWDAETRFLRGKNRDGSWSIPGFNPKEHSGDYTEGNAWQYLWFVPWDADGLAALFGETRLFLDKLDEFFILSKETPPGEVGGIRWYDTYYWHGNEPDIHTAYMYTLLRRPDKAAPAIRWIQQSKYSNTPGGLDGNDDGGALSSWYVWSAIGLYPLPAETRYLIGSPLFPKVALKVGNGKTFTIYASGASAQNMYVQRAQLNGVPLTEPWLEHADVVAGGDLVLVMGAKPGHWGIKVP